MTFNKFHHIGLEVPELETAKAFYIDQLGFTLDFEERLEEKKLKVAFIKGQGCMIELMCFDDSKDRSFAENDTARFQHLAFEVEDVAQAMKELQTKGITFDFDEPVLVFDGKTTVYNTFKGPSGEILEIAHRI
ncbi:MAG TPA: VOC family protein [Thermotogota bacterium]|nr:VOC family protein [Thermotogota bacterium]HPJ88979.1 VOC family protein [Thermotogota bacterium]HPR97260.1 VOC family protein [Thermotogota bacterium]